MTDNTPLSHEELLRLWETGRRMALSSCSGALQSLRQGLGGFYEADDLWQDLFLEFWELARRWHGAPDPLRHQGLWTTWRELLRYGGHRILRRRPQRLWRRGEPALAPGTIEVEPNAAAEGATAWRGLEPREEVFETADPDVVVESRAGQDEVEGLLRRLSATNRQALYLAAVANLSCLEVARCLWLPDEEEVRRRVHRSRDALRRGRRTMDALLKGSPQP